MAGKKSPMHLTWAWLILEVFVRIVITLAVIVLLLKYTGGIVVYIVIVLFASWVLLPILQIFNLKKIIGKR